MPYRAFWPFIFISLSSLLWAACLTSGPTGAQKGDPRQQRTFREANTYFQQGQYKRAMLKYTAYIYSPYPEKGHLEEARYRLTATHMMLDQPHQAYTIAKEFVQQYPNSSWAKQAKEIMAQAQSAIEAQNQAIETRKQNLLETVAQLEKHIREKDEIQAKTFLNLADNYWQLGNIQKAVSYYEKAAQTNEQALQDSSLRNRIRITDSGEFKVRDPLLDFGHTETVRVVNADLNRVHRDDFLGEYEYLRYSGHVKNYGLYDAHNVQIEVEAFDLFERLQDTRLVNIGTIPAGQTRPFAVMLDRFDSFALDVTKIHTQVYYDQP